jgi:membrane protein
MRHALHHAFPLLKQTFADWLEDKAARLAAALAFYTALSLAPLLVIAVAIASLVLGDEAARGEIVGQFHGLLGHQGAAAVEAILAASRDQSGGIMATVFGALVLAFGASGVFGELQDALDTIWEVKPRPGRGIKGIIRDRFFSFTMVLGVAFLLLVSLVVTAALSAASAHLQRRFGLLPVALQAINLVVAFGASTLLFALIFKVVPDVKVPWRDVWIGAVTTAALFSVGKYLIGLYLGRSSTASAYGAAGSLVAMLIWVYYSAQILFFGAELTHARAVSHGSRVEPRPNVVPVTDEARAQQGLTPPPAPVR